MNNTVTAKPAGLNEWRAFAFVATAGLFAMWGLAQWIFNVLFPQFTQYFSLTATQSTWTQTASNFAYFLFAIPSVLFQRTFGYKLGVIFALSSLSLGPFLLYPAVTQHGYMFFLAATAVLGLGWAWFETSVNALIVQMGRRETAVQRLNLAQAFYPIGLIIGSRVALWLLSSNFELSVAEKAPAVARPYVLVGVGVLIIAFAIDKIRFPAIAIERSASSDHVGKEFRTLLASRAFRLGLAAIAANIMAQCVTWGSTFSYTMQQVAGANPELAGNTIFWSIIILCAGRFIGAGAMTWLSAERMLGWAAAISFVLVGAGMALGGLPGLICLMASSFSMSIMYATIFATSLRDLGTLSKAGSGLLVAAAGAAAASAPFIVGGLLSLAGARYVVGLALPCFVVIAIYAAALLRTQRFAPAVVDAGAAKP